MKRPTLPMLVAAAGLLPVVALACPEGFDDSADGVTVRYEDGAVVRYTRESDGIVTEVLRFAADDDDGYRVVALHGLYMIEDVDIENGEPVAETLERQSFPAGLDALPAPEPGLAWSGTVGVDSADLPGVDRSVSLGIGARGEVTYGGCEYEAWSATLRYQDDVDEVVQGFDYLPALGIAVLRSIADTDGVADLYTPASISRADD